MNGKPDWSTAPEWAKYLAQDEDQEWFWFERKPVSGHDAWFVKREGRYANAQYRHEGWEKTLERRPK